MPELPEVETTKNGLVPFLVGATIQQTHVYHTSLRYPVQSDLASHLKNKTIRQLSRRSKYLIIHLSKGTLLIHLGMSGHIRIEEAGTPLKKHDHIELLLNSNKLIRYNDPRRFGLWLFCDEPISSHPLLAHLGPEPFSNQFDGQWLAQLARGKKKAVKSFLMDNTTVVGVGNIYATESLYLCNLHPATPASVVTTEVYDKLAKTIKHVLQKAIELGGTTLKDFYASDGKPGYFSQKLNIYGRMGKSCYQCNTVIEAISIAGRRSAYCPTCQPLTHELLPTRK